LKYNAVIAMRLTKMTTRGSNVRAKRAAIGFFAAIATGWHTRLRKDTKIAFET